MMDVIDCTHDRGKTFPFLHVTFVSSLLPMEKEKVSGTPHQAQIIGSVQIAVSEVRREIRPHLTDYLDCGSVFRLSGPKR